MRRPFFALLGLGAGLALGVWAVRTLDRTQRALRPDQLAEAAGERAGELRARMALAVQEGRRAAAAREAELREAYRVRETGRIGEADPSSPAPGHAAATEPAPDLRDPGR